MIALKRCGKSPGEHTVIREIEKTLVEHALSGKMVVRLRVEIHLFLEDA